MIWFGNVNRIVGSGDPDSYGPLPERERMRHALEWAAERAPHLEGQHLVEALAASGWVDRATAQRMLPEFRHFDADRHFADAMRRLSFRGRSAADDFRRGIRCIVQELTGGAAEEEVGPELGIRFRSGEQQGVVLAHAEVGFSIGRETRAAIEAAVEEMPDALVLVARNFDRTTAEQLSGLLHRTEVPGTLVTLNLLLGIRAVALRYRPGPARVVQLLGAGRPLRSADVARLGDRAAA